MSRRDSRSESFQRHIAALREQLGAGERSDEEIVDDAVPMTPEDMPAILTPSQRDVYAPATPVSPSAVPRLDAATGIVAKNSVWNGTLTSDGSIHVYGTAEGELDVRGDVYVAEGAHVDARLHATNVFIAGFVTGTVNCSGRLEVLPTGEVSANVSAGAFVVHDGAVVSGTLQMRPHQSDTDPES